jgi:hypothetical protein
MLMSRLEKRVEIETALLASFDRLLGRYRELRQTSPAFDREQGASPARKKDYRRTKAMRRHRERP